MNNILGIILAAGEGRRMKSDSAKILHKVCGKPMIEHVRYSLRKALIEDVIVVVGHKKEQVKDYLQDKVKYVVQKEQLGTGHAVREVFNACDINSKYVLVLCGDMPLITDETISETIKYHIDNKFSVTIISTCLDDPSGYGRIVRNSTGDVVKIVEHRDANVNELNINEVNSGMYCFDADCLKSAIEKVKSNNSQGEYYLTDTIEILINDGKRVGARKISDSREILGVNNRIQLEEANKIMRRRINERHMLNGVTFIDSSTTYIEDEVIIGKDTTIYPNTILEGSTRIGEGCVIGPSTKIISSEVGDSVVINNSQVLESIIQNGTKVGPFAYVRPGSNIGMNVKIGDFVEIKKSQIGDNTKISHLTYVGDAEVGRGVNLGCGVVVVNYDGKKKNKTIVGDNSFVGCNVNLISPVELEDNTFVAAGSTITDDVPKNSLAIARSRQIIKQDWVTNREENYK